MMLMMQTLNGVLVVYHEIGVELAAYNPAQTNIPVKTPFCGTEVRKRHSNGSGYGRVNTRLSG